MKASAVLGWRAEEVYRMTMPELWLALDGARQARGIAEKVRPMSKSRLLELVEQTQ